MSEPTAIPRVCQAAARDLEPIVRYVGRCRTCGHRGAVDAIAHTYSASGRTYTSYGIALTVDDREEPDPWGGPPQLSLAQWASVPFVGLQLHAHRAYKRLGLWCACDKALPLKPLKAVCNAARPCNDRCVNAVSITCDCACGGAKHGSAWIGASQFTKAGS